MRKTVVQKAKRGWEKAQVATLKAKQRLGWAVESWEKLPAQIERRKQQIESGARSQYFPDSWLKAQLQRDEYALAAGRDAYAVESETRVITRTGEEREAWAQLVRCTLRYAQQNLKLSIGIGKVRDRDATPETLTAGDKALPLKELIDICTRKGGGIEKSCEPRQIQAKQCGDAWVAEASECYRAMKGVTGNVVFCDTLIKASTLKQYLRIVKGDLLRITQVGTPADKEANVEIKFEGHKTHFRFNRYAKPGNLTRLEFVEA